METADSSKTTVSKVCSVDPKRSMTSFQGIHGYIYAIATLSFCNGYFKVYLFFLIKWILFCQIIKELL